MEISKKMYKYTAIISMTIVLVLIFSLVKPMLTIANTTYGISSINYDKNESVMTVSCTRLEENVNSFLYWVSTDEEIPTNDDLDELAVWCVKNAIKVVPLDSVSMNDSIKIKKTGKYYAVMLLKKANEEGTEEYVKAFVATYVVNTPITEEELKNHEGEEVVAKDVDELNNASEQEDQQETKKEPEQEVDKELEQESEKEPEQEVEKKLEQEPEKEIGDEPEQEAEKESEQEPKKDEDNTINSEESRPLYILINNINNENHDNKDEYIDVVDEEKEEETVTEQEQENKSEQETKLNPENIFKPEKTIEPETKSEPESKINSDGLPMLTDLQNNTQAVEDIPQTGSNEFPIILGIVLFSVIGTGSIIKYKKS